MVWLPETTAQRMARIQEAMEHAFLNSIQPALKRIEDKLNQLSTGSALAQRASLVDKQIAGLTAKELQMAIDLTNLKAAVQKRDTVDASVKELISGLSAQITDLSKKIKAGVDTTTIQQELDALTAQLESESGNLAKAVEANTTTPAPEAGGAGVGQIVGDRIQIELLRLHSAGSSVQRP